MPPVNVKVMLTCNECAALSATNELTVSVGTFMFVVLICMVVLGPGWGVGWAWGLRFGVAFFALLAMGRVFIALKLQKRSRVNSRINTYL